MTTKTELRVFACRLLTIALCLCLQVANAGDKEAIDANGNKLPPSASSSEPAGLLPIPDYSGDFWNRSYLTGDWNGLRTDLANKGIQIGVEWNQTVQGIASGGR